MFDGKRGMVEFWRITGSSIWIMVVLVGFFQLNFLLCWSLNDEGNALLKFRERVVNDPFGALSSWTEDIGELDHCSWFGIECADDGHVLSLELKNLCLEGTLAPELHHLSNIRSIILRNNSFSGFIPEEFQVLKELELLDLGFNNFSDPLLMEFEHNIPILLLDNNGLSFHTSPELEELIFISEVKVNKNHLTGAVEVLPNNRHNDRTKDAVHHRMLARRFGERFLDPSPVQNSLPSQIPGKGGDRKPSFTPPTSEQPIPPHEAETTPPTPKLPHINPLSNPIAKAPPPPPHPTSPASKTSPTISIVLGAVGGFIGLVLFTIIGIYLWRSNKITTIKPWATGLSGPLRKAFVVGNDRSDGFYSDKSSYVEGIPKLKRSDLESACEDFSNVIGSSSIGTIYKGTLSNGVEIAVTSLPVVSAKDWSRNLEKQFRKKIETLSKVNHKNFVNLIGYCEEQEPFTRMMVFEYAPNGLLFEHLHVREAEHLNWGMRLRIAMGMAYCLEHMHQLAPPLTLSTLNSSSVNFSDDYAAKISDFCSWNEVAGATQVQPIGMGGLSTSSSTLESNVYSFGLVLLEMMTGRVPLSVENDSSLGDWVSDFLTGEQPLKDLVDPMLRRFKPEQLEMISEMIRKCLHPEPQQRPVMGDVAAKLREITGVDRDKAAPRLSPLWWEELGVHL